MSDNIRLLLLVLWTGCFATACTDLWSLLRWRLWGMRPMDFGLLGCWLNGLRQGQLVLQTRDGPTPGPWERCTGWLAHYAIGVAFAALMPAVWGSAWLQAPNWPTALLTGVATVMAPWLLLQPAFGMGLAARKTRQPARTRLHSVVTHAVFGLGLYLGAWLAWPLWN